MTSVLIVDDDPGFRRLATLLLEDEGFEVVGAAADGVTAARAARELGPDVVLLDVNLTEESGFDVARRICRRPRRSRRRADLDPRGKRLRGARPADRRPRLPAQGRALVARIQRLVG